MADERSLDNTSGGSLPLIDTSGSRPSLRIGALATLLTGTVIWGWFSGFIDFLDALGSGIAGSLAALGSWLEHDLLAGIFGIAEDGMAEISAQNAAFLEVFGPFAQVVAVIEVAIVIWILLAVLLASTRRFREVFSA